jgi:hypothetical protein
MTTGTFPNKLSIFTMPGFAYRPLERARREIRLLQILPRHSEAVNADDADSIQCALEHASLDDKPEFQALSYTWGDASRVRKITLNGAVVTVTENLELALRHLQSGSLVKRLWVDAICINQQDDHERSAQVQQMRTIYESASLVIVWLGPAADDSDLA